MARGGAHEPCKDCGSTTRHKSGCSKPGREGNAPAPRAAPKVRRAAMPSSGFLSDLTVDELVEFREAVEAELHLRKGEAEEALKKIRDALKVAA